MKKTMFIKVLVLICVVCMIFSNICIAAFDVEGTFNGNIENDKAKETANKVKDVLLAVLKGVRTTGAATAIVILIVIGMKIMMAAPSEKANIKQYSINYVIGAFILFGASGILTLIQRIADSSFD